MDRVESKRPDSRRDTPTTETQRPRADRGGRLPTPSPLSAFRSPEKSPFEKMMDEKTHEGFSQNDAGSSQKSAPSTREAVKEVVSQQERYGKDRDQSRKRESDQDRDTGGRSEPSSVSHVKEAEKKVIGKGNLSEKQYQGQGGGSGMGHEGGHMRKQGKGVFSVEKESAKKMSSVMAPGKFELELQGAQSLGAKNAPPSVLTKNLVDQIVQYCRVVMKTGDEKEFDIQMHEAIFKGLRLRVSMNKGRVTANFMTSSREVRDLFQSQKSHLYKALLEKGIEVSSINVVMV